MMINFLADNFIFFALLWLFFAVITTIAANQKKRDIIFWMLVGMVFGIFGLIIILFLPVKERKHFEIHHPDKLDSHIRYLKLKEEFREYKEKQKEKNN